MKTAFISAILACAQLAYAQEEDVIEKVFAKCIVTEKSMDDLTEDGELMGMHGTLLFMQETGKSMVAFGILSTDEEIVYEEDSCKELRYVGISELAPEGTCSKTQMGSLWPFREDYEGMCALNQAKFKNDGNAIYWSRNSPAQLLGNDDLDGASIIDRSISIFGTESKDALNIDACCQIEKIEQEEFKTLNRALRTERKAIRRARREAKEQEAD